MTDLHEAHAIALALTEQAVTTDSQRWLEELDVPECDPEERMEYRQKRGQGNPDDRPEGGGKCQGLTTRIRLVNDFKVPLR